MGLIASSFAHFSSKSHEWAYEREWRVMADLKFKDAKTGFSYVDFGSQLQLREVILCARNEAPVGQVAKQAIPSKCLSSALHFRNSRWSATGQLRRSTFRLRYHSWLYPLVRADLSDVRCDRMRSASPRFTLASGSAPALRPGWV